MKVRKIMKKVLILIGCVLSFAALADDVYIPPTRLTPVEVREVEIAMQANQVAISQHWKARLLAMAKGTGKQRTKPNAAVNSLDKSVHTH
jgi:hypothetical protein